MTSMVQVWYATPETFRELGMGLGASTAMPDPNDLMATHRMVRVYEVDADTVRGVLAAVFTDMQGERWSPNGEARFLIRSLGLSHTSMSIGDVAVVDGTPWLCDTVGWTPLEQPKAEEEHVCDYSFSRSCGAHVCAECDDHKGLARCYCGWSSGGTDGYRELLEMGERIEEDY